MDAKSWHNGSLNVSWPFHGKHLTRLGDLPITARRGGTGIRIRRCAKQKGHHLFGYGMGFICLSHSILLRMVGFEVSTAM